MRARQLIRECPDHCGKDEYDLGVYRGFHLYQKPFFDGWWIFCEKEEPDELDRLLIPAHRIHNEWFSEEVTRKDQTLEKAEQSVIDQIDTFWTRKEALINKAKQDLFKIEGMSTPETGEHQNGGAQ